MEKHEFTKWLMIMKANLNSFPEVSNAKKIEALTEAIRLLKNEQSKEPSSSEISTGSDCISREDAIELSTTKNDLRAREFEEIVVEYPPEDLCTYPEYKGKPYFSIKYKEGNDCFIGYGTYKPQVLSRYLKDYFMSTSVKTIRPKGHWIETVEEYYKAINEKGGGVNENTDYFVDNIACSECLAKFSVIDNEAERFDFCPCCGSDNR